MVGHAVMRKHLSLSHTATRVSLTACVHCRGGYQDVREDLLVPVGTVASVAAAGVSVPMAKKLFRRVAALRSGILQNGGATPLAWVNQSDASEISVGRLLQQSGDSSYSVGQSSMASWLSPLARDSMGATHGQGGRYYVGLQVANSEGLEEDSDCIWCRIPGRCPLLSHNRTRLTTSLK
jgi:hypothetical protein